jgi:hypothetical protein
MNLRTFASTAALALAAVGAARWAAIEKDVPVETLLPNLEQQARANPNDAQAHYVLGRVHSLAFASGAKTVSVVPKEGQRGNVGWFASYSTIRVPLSDADKMTPERRQHLRRSIEEYEEAVRLAPDNALYHLGLGWMYETASTLSGSDKMDEARVKAIRTYRTVVKLRAEAERKMGHVGPGTDTLLAREAALGIDRLLKNNGSRWARIERGWMTSLAAELAKKPMAVTPILVPLAGETSLPALLDAGRTTRFDLAGDGLRREWPWVRPTTGILVWDPRDTGAITSARQLFGSATWWMFFRDGYEALASLDANRDGWLTGSELNGIRVWQDANGNGISDPGEVRPLGTWGITGLNARASHRDANGPRAETGILRADGSTGPSFDWVPTSAK